VCAVVEAEFPTVIVFDADVAQQITATTAVEPHVYVRRGGIAEFCADPTFWRLVSCGPVVVAFEDHLEASAIVESYAEARRRRLQ
jgi:hypothetical protein